MANLLGVSNAGLDSMRYHSTKGLTEEALRLTGLGKRDNIQVYTVKKGKLSNLLGSFTYKPMSVKAKQLQSKSYRLQSKLNKVKNSNLPPKEKQAQMRRLKCVMQYNTNKLNREMANTPRTGYIVVEEE